MPPSEVVAADRAVNLQTFTERNMMKARTSLWASLAIAASVGLAGCGGSSDNGDGMQGDPPPTAEQLAAAEQEAAAQKKRADDAQAKLDAAARKDAKDLANDIDSKDIATIDRKRTLTHATVGSSYTQIDGATLISASEKTRAQGRDITLTTGRTADDNPIIPALKQDSDDKAMYEGSFGTHKYTARVYTTAMDKEGKPFASNLPGDALSTPLPGKTSIGFYQDGKFTFTKNGEALETNGTVSSSNQIDAYAGINAGDFPTSAGVKKYEANERAFDGTLDGVAGEYACSGVTCEAKSEGGKVSFPAGTWTFTPDDDATLTVKDIAYLSYGWWLRMNKDGGIEDVGAVLFSDGGSDGDFEDPRTRGNIANLDGTATYKREKGAAGKYATDSEVGHFTADAELTATFGDTDSTGNEDYISGKIYNFATMSGDKDWMVALGKSGKGNGNTDPVFGGSTTWSVGDDKAPERGTYTAHLYSTEKDTASGALTKSPDEIGGTFKAQHGSQHMIGAFAATLTTDDDPKAAAAQ